MANSGSCSCGQSKASVGMNSCGCGQINVPVGINSCGCEFATTIVGVCNLSSMMFTQDNNLAYKTDYNWTEISIPEILTIPCKKPDIEHIDKVLIKAELTCVKLVGTPRYLEIDTSVTPSIYATDVHGFPIPIPNAEGTYLTGRKLVIEGVLKQTIVYTADVAVQSVHSAHYEVPFSAYMIVYPKFLENGGGGINVATAEVDLDEDFCVEVCIEDVHAQPLDKRTIFKSVTVFIRAKPAYVC